MATYDLNSYENINSISDVGVVIVVSPTTFTNVSEFSDVGIQTIVSPTTHENASTISSIFSIDRRYFASLDTHQNINTVGEFAINDNKLLDTLINQNLFSDIVAASDVILGPIGDFENYSQFGQPIVVAHPYEVVTPISTITRNPFSTITSKEIGFKKFKFRDLSTSFLAHPITGDLTTVTDFHAVAQSIKNIVLTNKTERHFNSIDFGVGIEQYLFNLQSADLQAEIQESILRQVSVHEPRAIIKNIVVDAIPENHQMSIVISYGIRTYEETDSIKLFLERA